MVAGVFKVVLGILGLMVSFLKNFGPDRSSQWFPDLMESVGWIGIVVSLYIILDGAKDIASDKRLHSIEVQQLEHFAILADSADD